MTTMLERGANDYGRRNEAFVHHSLSNLSGMKVVRILLPRNHVQIYDCSHGCPKGASRLTSHLSVPIGRGVAAFRFEVPGRSLATRIGQFRLAAPAMDNFSRSQIIRKAVIP